jgi:hypothetical protein
MLFPLIMSVFLGCTTRVHAVSTNATDTVQIVRGGAMPQEGLPIQGVPIAQGEGQAMGQTTYVLGRRFWAVATNDEGERSVVRVRGQAKAAPIVACSAGVLLVWPAAFGCLYVSGPTSRPTHIQGPGGER